MFADRVSGKEIPGSLRWEVFGIAAAYGGLEELKALLDLWNKSPNEDEQYLALECLGRAPNADLVKWVLSHIFTDSVKDQDVSKTPSLIEGEVCPSFDSWDPLGNIVTDSSPTQLI